jgi:hypothetical protein
LAELAGAPAECAGKHRQHQRECCTLRFRDNSKLTVLVRVNGSEIVEQSGP